MISEPTVKSLFLEILCKGERISIGTGFTVLHDRRPYLITNRHNVRGKNNFTNELLNEVTGAIPDEIVIYHNKLGVAQGRLGGHIAEWIPRRERLYKDEDHYEPRWIEHPTLKSKADFVALPLSLPYNTISWFPYDFTDSGMPISYSPGEVISVIGFPFGRSIAGYHAIWATGFVASEPSLDYEHFEDDCDYSGESLPAFLIDCRSRKGQSGSAVIAYRTGNAILEDGMTAILERPQVRFLGIYSGRINNESDIGIVWKAKAIRELVESISIPWDQNF